MQGGLPAGLRRVGRSEQGDNADKDMDSSPTKRSSKARDSRVNGMAMRPRSSSAGHEESSASVPPSASAIQWGDVTEVTVPSNREQSTRNGRAADPSGVCDLVAAKFRPLTGICGGLTWPSQVPRRTLRVGVTELRTARAP